MMNHLIQMMANSMAGKRSYELGNKDPIESTIEVTVNGQQAIDALKTNKTFKNYNKTIRY